MSKWLSADQPPDSDREVLVVYNAKRVGRFVDVCRFANDRWEDYDGEGGWEPLPRWASISHWQDFPALPNEVQRCETCGQSGEDVGGEYPCPTCGRPRLHDEETR